jgi:maleylpyruvate isomerase
MTTLYTFFRSSASFRVRIALNLKGVIPDSAVVVNLREGEQSGQAFVGVNPQGLVPAWIDDNGMLAQSMAIMEYLDERYPDPALLPKSPFERARVRSLAQLIACEIHPLNNLRVLKYLKRSLQQDEEGVNKWYRHWCTEGLGSLERQLNADKFTGQFSHRDTPGLADCCLVPQIFNAQRYQTDLTPFPTVMRIFNECMKLKTFEDATPQKQPEAQLFKD